MIFLSINRYERKKAIELAIDAFGQLKARIGPDAFSRVHLIIAGGYDTRLPENVEYHQELLDRARKQSLVGDSLTGNLEGIMSDFLADSPDRGYHQVERGANITFIRSFTDSQKSALLTACSAVLYTPSNEHFGIVPLEAMACSRPVVAVNSGGPLESVTDSVTGYLKNPTPDVR